MPNIEGDFLERNKHRSYPFVSGAYVANAPYAAVDVDSLFVDAYVSGTWSSSSGESTFEVQQFDPTAESVVLGIVLGTSPAYTLSLASGNLVASSPTDSDDGKYRTYHWYKEDTDYIMSVVLVVNLQNSFMSSPGAMVFSSGGVPRPTFVPRCVEIELQRVTSMGLRLGSILASIGERGDLVEGYNIRLRVDPDEPRINLLALNSSPLRPSVRRVLIEAIAGAGAGKAPNPNCGADSSHIVTINGQGATDGHFLLQGDGCYRIERPEGTVGASGFVAADNTLKIRNDCTVCCDCAEFAAILEEIRRLVNEGLRVKAIWESVSAAYTEILAEWQLKQDCAGSCRNHLFVESYTGWLVTVRVWIANPQSCAVAGASIEVEFSGGDYSPQYVPGSGFVYNYDNSYHQVDPTEAAGVFSMDDDSAIRGGGYRVFVFSVRMASSVDRVDGNSLQVDVEAVSCDEATEELTETVVLHGNTNKS